LKILYLTHRIPYPPNKGEKTRCFYQIQFLSARHTIDLFCFADSEQEAKGKEDLRAFCRSVHVEILTPRMGYVRAVTALFSELPASVVYYRSQAMQNAVNAALQREKYDLIFVYCSSMAQFIAQPPPVPAVIDFVDADSAKWKQYAALSSFPKSWLYAREGCTLGRYEKKVTERFNLSFVTTRQEVVDLGGGECRNVEVIENGVTTPPLQSAASLPEQICQLQPYALFVGTMNYRPNSDAVCYFAKEIYPLLRRTHPELRFLIVGRDPSAEVIKLSRLPGVVVTGGVPDVHTYVAGAAVAVAPFRIAQGVQNKVLEALVAGIPVVLTNRPARAISSPASELLLVAESPAEFARSVAAVLENPEFRSRAEAAAPKLQDLLAWESSLYRMESLIETVAGQRRHTESTVKGSVAVC
jgi:sugar transferase (PEP-CTERM/EpsH1 system associated)